MCFCSDNRSKRDRYDAWVRAKDREAERSAAFKAEREELDLTCDQQRGVPPRPGDFSRLSEKKEAPQREAWFGLVCNVLSECCV